MEQVFRIEIPVEVINKADQGEIKKLEEALMGVLTTANKTKKAASDAMKKMESGAKEAASSLKQAGKSAEEAGDGFEEMGDAAEDAADSVDDVSDATKSIDQGGKLDKVKSDFNQMGNAAKQAGASAQAGMNQAGQATDRFTQRIERSQKTLRSMFKEKFKLIVEALDKASPVLKTIWNFAKRLTSKAWHVAVRMKDFVTAPFRKLMGLFRNPITMALSVAGIGMGVREVVTTFNEFETGMSAVRSLTGATGQDFLMLKQTAKDLGAETVFSASEASQGMQYLAMAGWNTNQIIAAMPGLLDLAAAGATDLGVAADIVSDVMTAMGMSADQASRAADIFAKTATSSNTTIEGLGETLKYAAPVAHSFGLQLHEVSALAGMMANAGIKGSMAGTALRSSLMSMAAPTKQAKEVMKDLNISFVAADGSMKKMSTIVRELSGAFAGLTESQRLEYTETLFGTYASSAWLGVISQGADVFDEFSYALDNSAGAAKEMAAIRLDNLAGDLEELGGAVETAKLELMEKFDPYLRQAVQWLTGKIPEIQARIETAVDKAIAKAKEIKDFVTNILNSADFKNADGLAAKFFVLWDKIIAEPFQKWWDGPGQARVIAVVKRIAESIGNFLRGAIVGIFAAIKGEEIDFEGMNLTGLAKAGAEAAKTFVTSFAGAFDLKQVLGAMPGGLKAGLFGFGAIKVGSGILGISKLLAALKVGFGGVSGSAAAAAAATAKVGTTAAASAAGIGKAGVVLGGLKTALAAIPVWGWVAAAAITAVAVGVNHYNKTQEQNRQRLLHFSDGAKQAAEEYVQSAEKVREFNQAVSDIKTLEIKIKAGESNQKVITNLQAQLAELDSREVWLLAQLSDKTLTPEQIAQYQAELDQLREKRVELEAQLAANTLRATEVQEYMDELAGLKGREEQIKMALGKGVTGTEAEAYMKELEIIKSREETITLKLEGMGWVGLRLAWVSGMIENINTKKAEVNVIMSNSSLTQEQITTLSSELAGIKTRKAELDLQLTGASLEPDQVKAYRENLDQIKDKKAEIEAKIAQGGLTTTEIATLSEQYASLSTREAEITMMLSGQGLTQEQLGALVEQLEKISNREAEIKAEMAKAGMSAEDIERVSSAMAGIGDINATINVALAQGSLSQQQLEDYNKQLAEAQQRLIELSGGIITKEDFGENGLPSPEKLEMAAQFRAAEASRKYAELQGEVERGRRTVPQAVQKRDEYQAAYQVYEQEQSNIKAAQDIVTVLEAERQTLVTQYGNQLSRFRNDEITYEQFVGWEAGTFAPGIKNLQTRYEQEVAPLVDSHEGYYFTGKEAPNAWYMTESGGFDQVLLDLQDALQMITPDYTQAKSDYDTQHQSLVTQYQKEKELISYDSFQGAPDLAGKTLEELALNYTQLNDANKKMFEDAVVALDQLNKRTDYLQEGDKTQAVQVAELAAKSEVMETVKSRVQTIATNYTTLTEEQKKAFSASAEGAEALSQVNKALEALGEDKISSLDEINTALETLKGVDLSAFSLTKVQEAFVGVGGDATGAKTQVDNLIASLRAADGQTATTTLTHITNNITNNIVRDNVSEVPQNAAGGIYDGAFLSLVAEDGPEAIIPLGSKRRSRGIDLWIQAGRMLGINTFAEGGILAPYADAVASTEGDDWESGDDNQSKRKPLNANPRSVGGRNITVHVAANPVFQVEGGSSEDIMDKIRGNISELAELLGGNIASQLEDIVTNLT